MLHDGALSRPAWLLRHRHRRDTDGADGLLARHRCPHQSDPPPRLPWCRRYRAATSRPFHHTQTSLRSPPRRSPSAPRLRADAIRREPAAGRVRSPSSLSSSVRITFEPPEMGCWHHSAPRSPLWVLDLHYSHEIPRDTRGRRRRSDKHVTPTVFFRDPPPVPFCARRLRRQHGTTGTDRGERRISIAVRAIGSEK